MPESAASRQSLSPFISAEALNAALDEYQHALLTAYGQRMRDKLGLFSQQKGDNDLLDGLFALMIREERLYPDVPPAEP